jgi:membrane protein DedA with SNARE-associated domain
MPYRTFLICNAAGAILWSTVMVSLAWLSGKWIPIEHLIDVVSQAGLIGLVIVALLLLLAWIVNQSEARWLERPRKKP